MTFTCRGLCYAPSLFFSHVSLFFPCQSERTTACQLACAAMAPLRSFPGPAFAALRDALLLGCLCDPAWLARSPAPAQLLMLQLLRVLTRDPVHRPAVAAAAAADALASFIMEGWAAGTATAIEAGAILVRTEAQTRRVLETAVTALGTPSGVLLQVRRKENIY